MPLERAHPYIPNSAPRVRQEMLDAIGIASTEEIYAAIPARLRYDGLLKIEPRIGSEVELRRRLEGMLGRNVSTQDRLSFLGGIDIINHYALRGILWLSGRTPLRLIRYLDSAVKIRLLRRIGGGYAFIHRALLELSLIHISEPTRPY